ncbi:magnesium transporter [Anaerobacillus arseniciselenatis]|uniref:Magnesium transporter MgtE n=1 Tax=Anaerobacillus arseniciselenatis TaxID=85682 RepID=A0A1S2LR47_9BACI|nr:magnesium transporter [Anaerobacillus arseniciselenatis]OIJ14593.1 magnesium transporter [Anaerobacillus arseniciselenatis]
MVKLDQQNRKTYTNQIIQTLVDQNMSDFRELFFELHPTDQIEILNSVTKKQRSAIYKYVKPEEFAEIFQGLEVTKQKLYISELQQNYAIDVINNMPYDDVADFLAELPETTKDLYLSKMNKEDSEEVIQLLKYDDQTAGAIMTTEYISVSSTDTVGNVMERIRLEAPEAETIYYLYVIDEQLKLVGVLSLRDLIVSSLDQKIEDVMLTRVRSVETHTDQEEVARMMKKYDFLAVPVTAQGKLVGIVTVDDIMDVVDEETEEDFGEISAARGSLDANISAFSAAKKRSPWIIMLMFLGLVTAGVIGEFEETLEAVIILAAFIPLIMDSAGNTGTQALAVVVRGLALGTVDRSSVGKLLKREFGTGLMLGVICAITLLIVVPFLYPEGGIMLAAIVGVSLFITLSLATMVGAIVPLIINKLKIDPAVASGPFITTINDIMGLIIFFSIATALLDYLPQ